MVRIGLPSRSSLIHAAAVAATVELGLLRHEAYDPAAVHIEGEKAEILFARSRTLPGLLSSGELDVVFTSSDYVADALVDSAVVVHSATARIVDAHISLVERLENDNAPTHVFTSYSRLARQLCIEWQLDTCSLVSVAGSCESYLFTNPSSVAIDVVATGRTVAMNGLRVARIGPAIEWGWFGRDWDGVEDSFKLSASLVSRLRSAYSIAVAQRDHDVARMVRKCLA